MPKADSKKLTKTQLKSMALPHDDLMALLAAEDADEQFLGHARAIVIVCACAGTDPSNLPRTLTQLGVNGIAFQTCVFNVVTKAGFTIDINDIPDAGTSTLLDVVTAIQNAPKAA
jgi:hypothetical protein